MAVAAGVSVLSVAALAAAGIRVEWRELVDVAVQLTVLSTLWAWFRFKPRRSRNTAVIADVFLVTGLLSVVSLFGSLLQYPIITLGSPLADPWLAGVDRLLHIDLPGLSRWTAAHADVSAALNAAYYSLLIQFFVAPLILGLWLRDRAALWEFAWHFQFCVLVALIGLLLFPAESPWNYYPLDSLFDHTRFNTQWTALRNGTLSIVHPNDLEGLITFPSFHTAGGLLITWSFRRHPVAVMLFASVNVLLIAATVFSGTHYTADLMGAAAVMAVSVRLWRQFARTAPVVSPAPIAIATATIDNVVSA